MLQLVEYEGKWVLKLSHPSHTHLFFLLGCKVYMITSWSMHPGPLNEKEATHSKAATLKGVGMVYCAMLCTSLDLTPLDF